MSEKRFNPELHFRVTGVNDTEHGSDRTPRQVVTAAVISPAEDLQVNGQLQFIVNGPAAEAGLGLERGGIYELGKDGFTEVEPASS